MYIRAKSLLYPTLLVTVSALLSACGGTSEKNDTTQSVDTTQKIENGTTEIINGNTPSSIAQSSTTSITNPATSSAENSTVAIDSVAPKTTRLQLFKLSSTNITLTWEDAIDNTGISHYEIHRNGELITTLAFPLYSYTDNNLASGTEYTYTIKAFDLAGNASETSPVLSVRTVVAATTTNSASNTTNLATNGAPSAAAPTASANNTQSSLSVSSARSSVISSSVASSITNSSVRSSSSLKSTSSSKSSSKSSLGMSSSSLSSKSNSSSSPISSSTSSSARTIITWAHPSQREDGSFLELNEIGGYQIRYLEPAATHYTYITLNGNRTTEYRFPSEMQEVEFEIAVFDAAGLYSQFVKIDQ